MEVYSYQSAEEALVAAQRQLRKSFAAAADRPILFLSSGGSALRLLDNWQSSNIPACLTVGVVDERFSTDPTVNNYLQLRATIFAQLAQQAGTQFIKTVPQDGQTTAEFAQHYEAQLHNWRHENPEGMIVLTLGIGEDGHTAGIMPFPEDPTYFQATFNNPNQWVAAYNAGGKSQYKERVTVTLPFLTVANATIIFATGTNKHTVLKKILTQEATMATYPAVIIHQLAEAKLFTDLPAVKA